MGTKRDIPALGILEGVSKEWSGLTSVPTKLTLDDAKKYQLRVNDVTTKTMDGVSKVKDYVEDVNDGITKLSGQVNKSLIETVQIMSDLVNKLVPTETPRGKQISSNEMGKTSSYSSGQGNSNRSSYSSGQGNSNRPGGVHTGPGRLGGTPRKNESNEDLMKQVQESAKSAEKQQKLASLLETVNSTCEKVKSQKDIDRGDIDKVQGEINAFGKTLENEKERKERQEKHKKQQEEDAAREKKRKEDEERKRNPDSWDPLVLKGGSKEHRFTNTEVLCVVFAMEDSFRTSSLQCTNMEGQGSISDWLHTQHEEQASCPLLIRCNRNTTVNLEMPMEVYLPYSIKGTKHEPQVKISVDNRPWTYPDVQPKRKIDVFPKDIKYIGTTVSSFNSFRIIVVAVTKKRKFAVDKNGLKITEDCIHLQVPPDFGNDNIKIGVSADSGTEMGRQNFLGAQVVIDMDCGAPTTKDIDVKISQEKLSSQYKEKKAAYTGLSKLVISGEDVSKFQLDPFLEHLQTEGVINKKEANDNKNHLDVAKRIKHLLEMILRKPSAAGKVLVCLDKSGNSHIKKQIQQHIPAKAGSSVVEEKWRSVMVFRADDGNWTVLDPRLSTKLQKVLGCTLPAGNRYFQMMSLTVSDDSSEKDIQEMADDFRNHEFGTTVTLVCRQKTDDYQAETFIHVLPADQASKEINHLQKQGYSRGPMEFADFTLMDGETVELYMSGNIGLQYMGSRLPQGTVEKFPFRAHKDVCKVNCNIYVVDKTSPDQMDDDRYRGLLHYRVRARGTLKERTDAVEVALMKVTKQFLSHLSLNGDMQALGKFIASKMADRKEMHAVFVTIDTAATVKEIEDRVERQCKKEEDIVRYEATFFIWANQNKDEKDRKIEKILYAVRGYPWCEEARKFVNLYMKAGLFSEVSLLSMSKLLGSEWQDLAIALKLPETQMDYIKNMHLSEQDAKGKMLDKFRLTHYAIGFGSRLPEVFLQSLEQCHCSDELLVYVKSKMQ